MKALKRTMAGEYSRELGVRVLSGLQRITKLGFKAGGAPGYGLRRMLVGPNRAPKRKLDSGESKALATDRVILVPGPAHEVKIVREIYQMLIEKGYSVRRIASELNRRGIRYRPGHAWSYSVVYGILSHTKYTGGNQYGRTSSRLYTPRVLVPPSEWVFSLGAFQPIIDYPTFAQAQHVLYQRSKKTNEEMLEGLKRLLLRSGRLSWSVIKADKNLPSPATYSARFGSLRKSYELVGYGHPDDFGPTDLRRRTQALQEGVISRLVEMFPEHISVINRGKRWRCQLRWETGELISVLVLRRINYQWGGIRWVLKPLAGERSNITLLVRLDRENRSIMDLHLVRNLEHPGRFYLRDRDEWFDRGVPLRELPDFLTAMKTVTEDPGRRLA